MRLEGKMHCFVRVVGLVLVCILATFSSASCAGENGQAGPTAPTGASATSGGLTPAPTPVPAPVPQPPTTYTSFAVAGTVTDLDGLPMPNVVVTHPSNGSGVTTPAVSGPNGEFSVQFEVPNYYAGGHIGVPFVARVAGYEGPSSFVEIENFAVVGKPLRLRLQPTFEVRAGSPVSTSLMPNHLDWGWRGSLICPCLQVHVRASAASETRIRLTSPAGRALRVGARAQNSPNADPYEEPSAFFREAGSLVIDGGTAVSEIAVPAGFVYEVFAVVGRSADATDIQSATPFTLAVD